ncbi:MAG: site-2 protease family protein [Caldilineales bacterium]|nr:site-2 protease family protein [Caldilineales bacterium]
MTTNLSPASVSPGEPPRPEPAIVNRAAQAEATARQLHAALADVFAASEVRVEPGDEPVILFRGRLLTDAETALTRLLPRFRSLNYTPLLRREGKVDLVAAVPGIQEAVRSRVWVHVGLFLLTLVTTTMVGALLFGAGSLGTLRGWLSGLPFSLTLLAILGIHEMGHYLMARWHGMSATLPYFIPMPPPFIGTLGAVVIMRSPTRNRATLFDVGFGGPIAGFLVALPLLIIGLVLSEVRMGTPNLGRPLLIELLVALLKPHGPGYAVQLHPVAVAAYFGILLTGLNLVPVGQLDGGHVAYAALGRWAQPVALFSLTAMVFMGLFLWQGWLVWALLALFSGLRRPAPLNDITPLDPARQVVALGALLLFALTFVPVPFR